MKCEWPCKVSESKHFILLSYRIFAPQKLFTKPWYKDMSGGCRGSGPPLTWPGHLFLPDLTYSGFTHRHVMERKFCSDFSHWISMDSNTLWMTPHREPEQPWGPGSVPLSGMSSLQGKARGVMECWHTKAVRLPVNGWTANRSEHSPKYCIAQLIHLLKGGCCKACHLIFLATYILNNWEFVQSFNEAASPADSKGAGNRNYRWFSPKICHCQFIKNKSHSLLILRPPSPAPPNRLCRVMLWLAQALPVSACHLLDTPAGSKNISSHRESVLSLCLVDSQPCPYFSACLNRPYLTEPAFPILAWCILFA